MFSRTKWVIKQSFMTLSKSLQKNNNNSNFKFKIILNYKLLPLNLFNIYIFSFQFINLLMS